MKKINNTIQNGGNAKENSMGIWKIIAQLWFLPETTNASFGPHVTNPQVIVIYRKYSEKRGKHCFFSLLTNNDSGMSTQNLFS